MRKNKVILWAVLIIVSLTVTIYYSLRRVDVKEMATNSSNLIFADNSSFCATELSNLQKDNSQILGLVVNDFMHGKPFTDTEKQTIVERVPINSTSVYVALRKDGYRINDAWGDGNNWFEALLNAMESAKTGERIKSLLGVNAVEIAFAQKSELVSKDDFESWRDFRSNINRGLIGLEIEYKNQKAKFSPTYSIASNRSVDRLIEVYSQSIKVDERFVLEEGIFRKFEAIQALVHFTEEPKAYFMERGNTLVELENVDQKSVERFGELASGWLENNIDFDGKLTYKYWPSSGKESSANNMIRQWMATVALEKSAMASKRTELWDKIEKNIDYNLSQFYKKDGEFGTIEWNEKVKLGSLALAVLAIIEHPNRDKWKDYEDSILKTIYSLWNEDGSFTTFYKPEGRNDNQNFYPGEALLLLSEIYKKEQNEELLTKIMNSFRYYKEWHLDEGNRNPAFIPWHTQAYFNIYQITKEEKLKDFIFEMNDWLIPVQQWDADSAICDIQGRFYDPMRPFGPPHASATGVYLEGLIDAYELALEVKDFERTNLYRRTIKRGLRSVLQLQFSDEIDMFYVSHNKRNLVFGGLRTTVYDNEIRCDNVQHCLMAAIKIIGSFSEFDYN